VVLAQRHAQRRVAGQVQPHVALAPVLDDGNVDGRAARRSPDIRG